MLTSERVKQIIAHELGVEEALVVPGANLIEDLGADELDTISILMSLEEEFGIAIDEEAEQFQTVQELITCVERHL